MADEISEEEQAKIDAQAAADSKQAEYDAKLSAAEAKAAAAEQSKVKAEAERDAYLKAMSEARNVQQGQPTWTEDQWSAWEQETGITRKQALVNAQMTQNAIDAKTKEFDERARKAEERAAKADERLSRIESERKASDVKAEFYASKPALARYKAEVDEFLAMFSEADRSDPEKLKGLLTKAEIYAKGKVGDKMRTSPGSGSPKFERGFDESTSDTVEVDTSDLDENAARLVKSLALSAENEKKVKDVASLSRHGVAISGDSEWSKAREGMKKR